MLKKPVLKANKNDELDRSKAFQAINDIANNARLVWKAEDKTEEDIEDLISETINEIRGR